MPRKYRNVPTVVDGLRFDSQKEARRWHELKMLLKIGTIRRLFRQVKYPLIAHAANGDHGVVGWYIADFSYEEPVVEGRRDGPWQEVTEDVKGGKATMTPLFRWKAKHFRIQYGRDIRIV